METKAHLEYLKQKYQELNRQFLTELQDGKNIHMLKEISIVMNTLQQEIEAMEKKLHAEKGA